MTLLLMYLGYGAFYVYHLYMKDLLSDEDDVFEPENIFVALIFIVLWPVSPFICANELALAEKKIKRLEDR